jgi:hypothetical protein
MRIIENNYKDKEQEYEITCPHCRSKLAYRFDDVISDRFKGNWIDCPVCDKEISIYDDEIPTADTIQYPKDFFSYADSVSIKDAEINKWVKECVNDLDDDTGYSLRATGDTMVFAYKSDEDASEATVIVAKKYQETDVKISRKNF